ncbi:prepilin-type N-terminal cleavage/methylation domain-containing protein [Myxococcus sp. RHSTA-1-4]|uniref:pilus assembly FimT family protein n=1 Tax=Myxococcus sp. RHSTA-1-4 TaxID=2874601 RepID=UPI001CBFD109|nr:prepilin-type N-terminal cleavage/methylation domain-containing protein [Myxococcus sp. RHSTA-1-4]
MRATQRGMTLLELMTTVAIAGILLGLGVTGFQAVIRNQRASAAERSILIAAQEARRNARLTRQPVRLGQVTTTENGVEVPGLRWEKLDCANAATDNWGSQCPLTACLNAPCNNDGGPCTCTDVGEAVPLSPEMDVSSLVGTCWLGESGRPVAAAGATSCNPTGDAPAAGTLRIRRKREGEAAYTPTRVLVVDPLTGAASMVDCEKEPAAAGCAP